MKKIIIFLTLLLSITFTAQAAVITNYQGIFLPGFSNQDTLRIAIRYFYRNNQPSFLVVNPYNFVTTVVPAIQFVARPISPDMKHRLFDQQYIESTPYVQALNTYASSPTVIANNGVTHAEYPTNGMYLTIDMCPSTKPFEQAFFQSLVSKAEQQKQALPIAISITGEWILGHPQEFAWLISQEKQNYLSITWMNHSFSHLYYPDVPINENFLLLPNINPQVEILATEKLLLENDQVPSVFFRFPGLISNQTWILKLKSYGLIPVGSDAWLAKGEVPAGGSIILVHGNGNEHAGIEDINTFLAAHPTLNLMPLSQLFKANS